MEMKHISLSLMVTACLLLSARNFRLPGQEMTCDQIVEEPLRVLKSLVAWERDGAQVRNVAYDALEELRLQ
jgi:hypothetical protein